MARILTFLVLLICFKAQATVYTLVQSGTWDTPASWNPAGVPGVGDDVIINDPGGENSLTVTLTGNVTINSLTYNGYYHPGPPEVTRTTILGSGGVRTLTLSSASSWNGGVFDNVELIISSGVGLQVEISGHYKALRNSAKITNNGTFTWNGGGIYFFNTARIENNFLFVNNTTNNRLYSETNSAVLAFINAGTFDCNSTDFSVNIHFQNSGTININSGFMRFTNLISNTGTINLFTSVFTPHKLVGYSGAGTVHFGANNIVLEFDDVSTVGNITLGAGFSGTIAFVDDGLTSIQVGSTVTVNQSLPANIALNFSAAKSVIFNVNHTLTSNTSFPSSLLLSGSGILTIPSGIDLTWASGRVGGSIELIVDTGGKISFSTGDGKDMHDLAKLTIKAGGIVDLLDGVFTLTGATATVVNNGTFNIYGNSRLAYAGPNIPTFTNNNMFKKVSGSGVSQFQIQPYIINDGIISVESAATGLDFFQNVTNNGTLRGLGTMSFAGSQMPLGGTITPGLSPGTLTLDGNRSFSGLLLMELDGNTTDKLVVNGTLNLAGATMTVTELSALPLNVGFTLIEATSIQNFNPASVTLPSDYEINFIGNKIIVSNGPLPVELTTFTGHPTDAGNRLHWETASETNSAWYLVERSADGRAWKEIGQLDAAGFSTQTQVYDFEDPAPWPLSYYRLRMVDQDGSFEFSKVIVLERTEGHASSLNLFPNPATESLTFELYSQVEQDATLLLTDNFGKVLRKVEMHVPEGVFQNVLAVGDLVPGVYLLEIQSPGSQVLRRFVKQ